MDNGTSQQYRFTVFNLYKFSIKAIVYRNIKILFYVGLTETNQLTEILKFCRHFCFNMSKISDSFAKKHVERWTNAWNAKDLETVLSMFADNIEFYSPKIKVITPEFDSGKVNNKQDLKQYWSTALDKITSLHFTPKEYYIKEDTLVLEYTANFDGKSTFLSMEKFEFNDDNLIGKASAFYGSQIE